MRALSPSDRKPERRVLPASLFDGLSPWCRRWTRLSVWLTLFYLGLHLLYVIPPSVVPDFVVSAAGFLLFFEMVLFFGLAALGAVLLVLVWVPVGFLALVRRGRGWVGRPDEDGPEAGLFRVHPGLYALGWVVIAFGHLGLDLDPRISVVGFSGLLLLLPETWRGLERLPPLRGHRTRLILLSLGVLWALQATDGARALAIGIWVATLLLLERVASTRVCQRDRLLFAVYALCGVQLISSLAVGSSDPPGSMRLGSGMAYSFVECQGKLFAAVPRCVPGAEEIETCRAHSSVDEYQWNGRRFRPMAQHRFFGEHYAGRIEQLSCLDDRVGLGLDWTLRGDTVLTQSHIEFDVQDPRRFQVDALGGVIGDGLAYDANRRRVFYTSDLDAMVVRDLETDERQEVSSEATGVPGPSDLKFHRGRDSVLVLGYYSAMAELSPEDFSIRQRFAVLNPWELVVDEELDRAYVAGSFGLEVVDLAQGRTIRRARVGLGGRRPAIDPCNQVIYVPTTAGARLFAFDRLTLGHLGDVPLGTGIRYPYVTESGFLLTTNESSHFAFDAALLAQGLRGSAPAPPPGAGCKVRPEGTHLAAEPEE